MACSGSLLPPPQLSDVLHHGKEKGFEKDLLVKSWFLNLPDL